MLIFSSAGAYFYRNFGHKKESSENIIAIKYNNLTGDKKVA